jgi:hypothetical protein
MKISDFRKNRGLHFVKRGMRVIHTHNGKKGRIAGANSGANLNIIFDGQNYSENCHPYFMMQYFDDKGKMIAEFKN